MAMPETHSVLARPFGRLAVFTVVACVGCGDASAANEGSDPQDVGDTSVSPDFRSFTLSSSGGPCNVEDDCAAFIELSMDATLRIDRWGEFPVVVHEAIVLAEDLAAAIPVLADPELVALLGGPVLPCSRVTDSVVSMEVVLADGSRRNNITTCEDAPIKAALATIRGLSDAYLPED